MRLEILGIEKLSANRNLILISNVLIKSSSDFIEFSRSFLFLLATYIPPRLRSSSTIVNVLKSFKDLCEENDLLIYNVQVLRVLEREYELNNNEPIKINDYWKQCKNILAISRNNFNTCIKNMANVTGHVIIDEENQPVEIDVKTKKSFWKRIFR